MNNRRQYIGQRSLLSAAVFIIMMMNTACLKYPRFTFGDVPAMRGCVAVFPLVPVHPSDRGADTLSEYIYYALVNNGVQSAVGPNQVRTLATKASISTLPPLDLWRARVLGGSLEADAVLFGNYFHHTMTQKIDGEDVQNGVILIGVDLLLYDIESDAVTWLYSTRFFSNQHDYLVDLSKLARDVGLTFSTSMLPSSTSESPSCWDEKKVMARLHQLKNNDNFFASIHSSSLSLVGQKKAIQPKGERPANLVVPAPISRPSKSLPQKNLTAQPPQQVAEASPILSGKAKEFYQKLKKDKSLVLNGLFRGRSANLNTKTMANFVALGKALLAMPAKTTFEIHAHVDGTRDKTADQALTVRQAQALVRRLEKSNPALKGHLKPKGSGGSRPIIPNINKRAREKNRRIVIRLQ